MKMITSISKKFISILLAFSLVVSASAFAFADDDAASVPEVSSGSAAESSVDFPASALLSTVTDENVIEYDDLLREAAYQTAVRSSGQYNYDAGDIYNLLWQTLVGNGNYYVKVYDNNTYNLYNSLITNGLISDILTSLQNIEGYNTYTDGIVQYTTASLLHAIASNITTNNSSLTNGLFDYNQNPYLGLIYTNIGTFETLFDSYATNSLNHLNSIDSKVNYIEQYTSYIAEATEQSLIPNVAHIDSDLHDIKQWLNDTFYYTYEDSSIDYVEQFYSYDGQYHIGNYPVSTSGITYNSNQLYLQPIITKDMIPCDVYFPIPEGLTAQIKYANSVPIFNPVNNTIARRASNAELIQYANREIINNCIVIHFTYDWGLDSFAILSSNFVALTPLYNSSHFTDIPYIPIVVTKQGNYIEDINNSLLHIDNDLHLGYDILSTFKELYASDDLIAAKENQQELEDSVLEDFTGSGSASASVSDALDIKGVQSSLKGSLNTGDVNASGLSTILNTSSPSSDTSFFKFWTQDVYNDVNGINNIPQTRGGDTYIFLNDSEELERLIRSQSW